MAFSMEEKDPRKWTAQYQHGSKTGFIMEFVPEGDSIKKWKEMAAHQIAFTKDSLRKYVDTWKGVLLKADAKVDFKEETMTDGSIFVIYTSASADMSMRRFIKGKDGVYMLAYHVRHHDAHRMFTTFVAHLGASVRLCRVSFRARLLHG